MKNWAIWCQRVSLILSVVTCFAVFQVVWLIHGHPTPEQLQTAGEKGIAILLLLPASTVLLSMAMNCWHAED